MLQYRSFEQIGVSNGIPISVGMQLTANAVVGTLFLGDWPTLGERILGFGAIAIIVIGIYLTTLEEKKESVSNASVELLQEVGGVSHDESKAPQRDMRGGLITLTIAIRGLCGLFVYSCQISCVWSSCIFPTSSWNGGYVSVAFSFLSTSASIF